MIKGAERAVMFGFLVTACECGVTVPVMSIELSVSVIGDLRLEVLFVHSTLSNQSFNLINSYNQCLPCHLPFNTLKTRLKAFASHPMSLELVLSSCRFAGRDINTNQPTLVTLKSLILTYVDLNLLPHLLHHPHQHQTNLNSPVNLPSQHRPPTMSSMTLPRLKSSVTAWPIYSRREISLRDLLRLLILFLITKNLSFDHHLRGLRIPSRVLLHALAFESLQLADCSLVHRR